MFEKTNSMQPFRLLCIFALVFFANTFCFSQVLISSAPGKADTSAMLEVKSNNRGFLPPRVSRQQRKAIKNPAPGLIVFDTTKQRFYGYLKGEGWRPFLMGLDTAKVAGGNSPQVIDNNPGDNLGYAVAIHGNLAVATAPYDDIDGKADQGSLYVFRNENGNWINIQKLTAPDGAVDDHFGTAVAMTKDFVFVATALDDISANVDEGSVYVFRKQGDTLIYQQKLLGSSATAGDFFAYYVAAQGNKLFVGAPLDNETFTDQGSAYYFELNTNNGQWEEKQKIIQDSTAANEDFFGYGISIDSNRVSIGGEINTTGNYGYGQNAVFIYERVAGLWQRRQKVLQPDVAAGIKTEAFGYGTYLKDSILTVGAWLNNVPGGNKDRGSAYVFKKTGNTWGSIQKLSPTDVNTGDTYGDYFGFLMRGDGKYLVVSANYEDLALGNIDKGGFYLFEWVEGQWVERQKVVSPNPVTYAQYGYGIDIQGGNIIVGEPSTGAGKVYFYDIDD